MPKKPTPGGMLLLSHLGRLLQVLDTRETSSPEPHLAGGEPDCGSPLTNDQILVAFMVILSRPDEVYQRCDDHQRRLLNQALFHRLYLTHGHITEHQLTPLLQPETGSQQDTCEVPPRSWRHGL
jgi:hypothetical protein